MANENPTKKTEKGGAEGGKKEEGIILIEAVKEKADERAKNIIDTVGEIFRSRSERIKKNQEQKKEASGALLGCKLGVLGLGGIIALALGGAIIGLQKLATADKWFMKGFNSVSPGGMKGGGGKKEKA